jgi:hypothetical protein
VGAPVRVVGRVAKTRSACVVDDMDASWPAESRVDGASGTRVVNVVNGASVETGATLAGVAVVANGD